jgi:2'-5' RNA ligase
MDQNASISGWMFLAALPDAAAAARIYRLARVLRHAHKFNGNLIEPERLHISLFFLGELSQEIIRIASEAAAEVRMPAFDVVFDRSASFSGRPGNRPLVLIGDDGMDRLKSLRRTFGVALAMKGLKYPANRDFTPHVTLLYADRTVEEYPIEPISWTVNEFALIHSKRGHIHLARWPLRS